MKYSELSYKAEFFFVLSVNGSRMYVHLSSITSRYIIAVVGYRNHLELSKLLSWSELSY